MARKPSRTTKVLKEANDKFMGGNVPPKFNGPMSLCGQAEDAISTLEARLSKIIRRINSINNL